MSAIYCLRCGHGLTRKLPPGDSLSRLCCMQCGFIYYENPKLLVACILYAGNKLLWMKRASGPFADRWAIPGGFVELGETVVEAACREVREETCLTLDPREINIYGVLSLPHINEVHISLISPLRNQDYAPTPEASELRLMSEVELTDCSRAFSPGTDSLVHDLYGKLQTEAFKFTPAVLMHVNLSGYKAV
jgi:ADP-ribose pyrophosphatase YjhB (NUDIX family)